MSDHGDEMTDVRQTQPIAQTRILALGDWPADRLFSSKAASTFALPAHLANEVELAWKSAGARPGVNLFDGPMCRLEHFTTKDGLHLHLSPTSYKYFIGTNGQHPHWADLYGQHVMANPVGTSVLLRSTDGQLLCGQRSQSVALYPGCAHPFGGTLEPGLVEDSHLRQPELVYIATTKLSAKDISDRIDPIEHHGSWAINDHHDAISETLATGAAITPVLAATLLAYGRWQHGETWLLRQLSSHHKDDRHAQHD